MKTVNEWDALEAHCGKYLTLTEAAKALGITKQYLSDILRNKRDITPRVLAKLGLRQVVVKETTK